MALHTTHTYTADNLIVGKVMPIVNDYMTVAQHSEAPLKRGTLLDATGTMVATGTEVHAVLAEDVDATKGTVVAAVFLTGEFNIGAVTVNDDTTAEAKKASARKMGIFLKEAV